MKFCKYCNKEVPLNDEEHWRKVLEPKAKLGYIYRCKLHECLMRKDWHQKHPDYAAAYSKKSYTNRKEKAKAYAKEYHKKYGKKYNNPEYRKKRSLILKNTTLKCY